MQNKIHQDVHFAITFISEEDLCFSPFSNAIKTFAAWMVNNSTGDMNRADVWKATSSRKYDVRRWWWVRV